MGKANLNDLIQSLTSSEKGYFKKFSTRTDRANKRYIKLFNALEKGLTEDKARKQFKDLSDAAFSRLKNYLYDQILTSLYFYRSNTVGFKIQKELVSAKILYERGLYELSFEELLKAEETSNAVFGYEWGTSIGVNKLFLSQFISAGDYNFSWDDELSKLRKQLQDVNEILQALEKQKTVFNYLRKGESEQCVKIISELAEEFELFGEHVQYEFKHIILLNTLAAYYWYNNDSNSSYSIYLRIVGFYNNHEIMREYHWQHFFMVYRNLFITAFMNGLYTDCSDILKQIYHHFEGRDNYQCKCEFLVYEVMMYAATGGMVLKGKTLASIEQEWLELKDNYPRQSLVDLHFWRVVAYYRDKNFRNMQRYIKLFKDTFLQNKGYFLKNRIVNLLQLIVLFEREDADGVTYFIRNNKRANLNNKSLPLEEIIISFIHRWSKNGNVPDYTELIGKLTTHNLSAEENMLMKHFNFIEWAQSRNTKP